MEANKLLWASAVQALPTDKQTAAMARRDVKRERDSVLGVDVVFVFIFFVKAGLLNCNPVPRGTENRPREAL